MDGIIIRNERESDYRRVEFVTREAFWNMNAPGCEEHYLAHILRGKPDFVPELDLVAEKDGEVIGSILYAKGRLVDETGQEKPVLAFGPISVLPCFQRQGVGKALIEESFVRATRMGYDAVVIFGHPGNYIARGFKSCKKYAVSMPGGGYPTAMLVRELREGALSGHEWTFYESPDYAYDPADAEVFDRSFPPKEKRYEQRQEEFFIYSHSTIG